MIKTVNNAEILRLHPTELANYAHTQKLLDAEEFDITEEYASYQLMNFGAVGVLNSVVRCKDCKYRGDVEVNDMGICNWWFGYARLRMPTDANDFCSHGERAAAND